MKLTVGYLEKINKINKPLATLQKKKKTQVNKIGNERRDNCC